MPTKGEVTSVPGPRSALASALAGGGRGRRGGAAHRRGHRGAVRGHRGGRRHGRHGAAADDHLLAAAAPGDEA